MDDMSAPAGEAETLRKVRSVVSASQRISYADVCLMRECYSTGQVIVVDGGRSAGLSVELPVHQRRCPQDLEPSDEDPGKVVGPVMCVYSILYDQP